MSSVTALTPLEEDFFRAGDELSLLHDLGALDHGYRSTTTLWQSIIGWFRCARAAGTTDQLD